MKRRIIAGVAVLLCARASTPGVFAQTGPSPLAPATFDAARPPLTVTPLPGDGDRASGERRRDELLPSFGSLFSGLGRDFAGLPTIESAVILGVAGAAAAGVHEQDRRITNAAAYSTKMDALMEPGAVLGGGLVQIGGAFATFAIGRAIDSPRVSLAGADLVRAQLLTAAMTQSVKLAVGRRRPDGTRYSFPSGHTSTTFATATVLQRHFGWKAGIPGYAFATYVAASRLQENKHYLSDVLFGAAIGVVAGRTVTVGHGRARFALAPMASLGGGGVGVTWVPPR